MGAKRKLGMKSVSAIQSRMAALRSKLSKGKTREDNAIAAPSSEQEQESGIAVSRSSSTSSMQSLASNRSGGSSGMIRVRRTPSWLAKKAPPPPSKPPPIAMPSLEENGALVPPPPSQLPTSSSGRKDSKDAEEESVQAFLNESKRRSMGRKMSSSRALSMTRTRSKRSLSSQMDLSIKLEAVTDLWARLQVSAEMNWCCLDVQVRVPSNASKVFCFDLLPLTSQSQRTSRTSTESPSSMQVAAGLMAGKASQKNSTTVAYPLEFWLFTTSAIPRRCASMFLSHGSAKRSPPSSALSRASIKRASKTY